MNRTRTTTGSSPFFRRTLLGAAAILLLAFASAPESHSRTNPFPVPGDAGSVSESGDLFAPLVNPVFNDAPGSSLFGYRYSSYMDNSGGSHQGLLRLLGFSLSYSRYSAFYERDLDRTVSGNANLMSVSKGFFLGNTLGLGGAYSFSRSGSDVYDDYRSWTLGLLVRPFRYLSLGAVFRDVGAHMGGENLKRSDVYSVSVRPFTDYLTFSADALREQGEKYSRMSYSYSLQVRVPSDITLSVKYDDDKNLFFGLQIPLFYRSEGMARNFTLDSGMSRYSKGGKDGYRVGFLSPVDINRSAVSLPVPDNMLFIRLNKTINENQVKNIFKDDAVVFFDIITGVRAAAEDATIRGIVLQIDSAGLDFAQTQELRDELKRAKAAGKEVYAILTSMGNIEYYLAAAADKIYFTPNSSFTLQGLSAGVYFFKDLLDSAGVKYESIRKGKYKSLNESFVRQNMSPEFRENLRELLSDLNGQFMGDIAADRKLDKGTMDRILGSGIMTPEESKKNRFVDEVMYPREAMDDMGQGVNVIKLADYLNEQGRVFRWGSLPEIAVVYVGGTIIDGESKGSRYVDSMGDDTFRELMTDLFSNSGIRAIVIRINSGGGSATASDNMLNTILELKKEYGKPVIFSFGNMAASGGYYIACTGDKIFSGRGTVSGSIGVIFGKLTLKDLYKKLGISKEVIKLSEYADIFSEAKDLTEKERAILQYGIDFMYSRFTDIVMKARNYKKEEIESVAEGRIFTGSQAKVKRLVDEMGGLAAAVEFARMQGGIDGEFRIAEYPERELSLHEVFSPFSGSIFERYYKKLMKNVPVPLETRKDTLYVFPYKIVIE